MKWGRFSFLLLLKRPISSLQNFISPNNYFFNIGRKGRLFSTKKAAAAYIHIQYYITKRALVVKIIRNSRWSSISKPSAWFYIVIVMLYYVVLSFILVNTPTGPWWVCFFLGLYVCKALFFYFILHYTLRPSSPETLRFFHFSFTPCNVYTWITCMHPKISYQQNRYAPTDAVIPGFNHMGRRSGAYYMCSTVSRTSGSIPFSLAYNCCTCITPLDAYMMLFKSACPPPWSAVEGGGSVSNGSRGSYSSLFFNKTCN